MRRAEFRPRQFDKSHYGVALKTQLVDAPVVMDEEPVDPDKPLPGQPVPGPQDPPDPKPQDPPAKAAPKQRRVK